MTDDEVKASLTPYHVLGLTMWAEARSEPLEGIVAVGCVVRNRADRRTWYGKDIKAVCLKPSQFSCWNPGTDENHVKLMKLAALFVSDYAVSSTIRIDPALKECLYLAQGVINRDLRDAARGCTHYLTAELYERQPPAWARVKQPELRLGGHLFFKDVD